MFNQFDVVKWKYPQNPIEKDDVMIVEGQGVGAFVTVTHIVEDGYNGTSNERMEDLKYVGKSGNYERPEDVYERYHNI